MRLGGFVCAILASTAIVGCATTGNVLPTVFTETGGEGALLANSEPTTYATDATGAKMLDAVENQGALSQLVLDMPATEALLNAELMRLRRHWPHPLPQEPKVKLTLLSQYSGATYADGTITLGIGTFVPVLPKEELESVSAEAGTIGSDEELLFLLGHEFAHYARGHHNKSNFMANALSASGKLTNLYNQAALLRELRYQKSGNQGKIVVRNEGAVKEDWEDAIGKFDLINSLAVDGLTPAWNRGQEDESDVLALDLLRAEGIEGAAYEEMFSNLKAHETLTEELQGALQASLLDVQQQLLSPDNLAAMLDGQAQATSTGILNNVGDTLLRKGAKIGIDYLGQTHRPPEVRLKGVQTYEQNAYGVTPEQQEEMLFLTEPTTEVVTRLRSLPEFQNATNAALAYYASIDARSKGKYPEAEQKITTALSVPGFSSQAALLFEAGRVAESSGNPTLAISRYKRAVSSTPIPETYRRLASVQIRSGLYSDAEQTINQGINALSDEDYFLPSKIRLAVAREEHDSAVVLLNTCRGNKSNDLVAACEAARAGVDFDKLSDEQKQAYAREGRVGAGAIGGFFNQLGNSMKNDESN